MLCGNHLKHNLLYVFIITNKVMNGFFADIIFHVKKELQKKHLTVHVRMKKRLKSYSLIRVEPASLTSQKSGLLCKVKVIITGKTLMSF